MLYGGKILNKYTIIVGIIILGIVLTIIFYSVMISDMISIGKDCKEEEDIYRKAYKKKEKNRR